RIFFSNFFLNLLHSRNCPCMLSIQSTAYKKAIYRETTLEELRNPCQERKRGFCSSAIWPFCIIRPKHPSLRHKKLQKLLLPDSQPNGSMKSLLPLPSWTQS